MLQEKLWMRIIVCILNLFSLVACSTILWTYIRVPRLRNHPGKLIFLIFLLQIVSLLYFFTFSDVFHAPFAQPVLCRCLKLIKCSLLFNNINLV